MHRIVTTFAAGLALLSGGVLLGGAPLEAAAASPRIQVPATAPTPRPMASAPQPDAAAITGWPARAPMLEMTCPSVQACFAVGSLPPPATPSAKPPVGPPGGVIASTDDGGATWTIRTDRHSVYGPIACPSSTQCYVTSVRYKVRTVTAHVQVATTTVAVSVTGDGGKTWQERPLPAGTGTHTDLACPGVATCVLWGYSPPGRSPQASVLITRNGGRTWKASRTVVPRRPSAARLACPTTRTCYLYGGFTSTAISASKDGGATWHTFPGTDMFALSGVPPHTLANMGTIACPSARICYTAQGDPACSCDAWGPYGTIFGTHDGGKHWSRLYKAPGRDFPEGVISCPGVSVCYVVGSKQRDVLADQLVLSTKDGGRTWATHSLPVVGLACPGIATCYAFSNAGAVFKTTNGGASWHALQ